MPRQKSTPRRLDDAGWTHVVFGMKRLRRGFAATAKVAPAPPAPPQPTCRHCTADIPPDSDTSFRGYCGMDCASDDGYLKGYNY
jgi:hypothetical protein